jgi:transposase-like protein
MRKRAFTAKDKARIVQEALLGEKEINQIASENDLAPAQIRKWRAEAFEKLEMIFDAKRDNKLKEKIAVKEL